MMRRIISFLLLTALCAALSGCSAPEETPSGTSSATATDPVSTDPQTTLPVTDPVTDFSSASQEPIETVDLPEYSYEERQMEVQRGDKTIRGVAYLPQREGKLPLVLCAHGLGSSYRSMTDYAARLAQMGLATYCFDFCGGGVNSTSDGSTAEMSVMTEVADLEAVLNAAKTWDFVDPSRIILLGASQGGIVSAVAAARHEEDVNGLILCFPAFVIPDYLHTLFPSLDKVPETYDGFGLSFGKVYAEDLWDYDPYQEIGNYKKPVLILHGTADLLVPLLYSQRAAAVYPAAELKVIQGAGHGFTAEENVLVEAYAVRYLLSLGVFPEGSSGGE